MTSKTSATKKRGATPGTVRSGRPPRELDGEVDKRILDAAQRVFLDRGFEGASIEEIAGIARAGKPTIYARFADKGLLFAAVVARNVEENLRLEDASPTGTTLEARLASIGTAVIERALLAEMIGLFRATIAEAQRFPELATSVGQLARERGLEAVIRLLAEVAKTEDLLAFASDRIEMTARFFLDLVVLPLVMRGLFGDSLETLREEIDAHVASRAKFFVAACRQGTFDN